MPRPYSVSVELGHVFVSPGADEFALSPAIAREASLAAGQYLDQAGYRVRTENDQQAKRLKVTVTITEED